jgi:hypothetical protein
VVRQNGILLFLLVQYLFTLSLAFMRYKLEIKLPVALPLMLSVCFLGALWKATDNGRATDTGRYARIAVGLFYLFLLPICVLAYSRDTGFGESWYRYFVSYGVGVALFLGATRISGNRLRWLAPLGGVGYIIFLSHPSVFAIVELLGFRRWRSGGSGPALYRGDADSADVVRVLRQANPRRSHSALWRRGCESPRTTEG